MTQPFATGFRPEPHSDKFWSFEEGLKDRMTALVPTSANVDLRPFSSPRQDQGSTSSCVAHAVVKALEIKRIMQHGHSAHVDLSRLMVYYLAREFMFPPETHKDEGTYISLACDTLRRFGVAPEKDWQFEADNLLRPPSWGAMRKAYLSKITSFYKIFSEGEDRVQAVAAALRAGNPVVFGTTVGAPWWGYGPSSPAITVPAITEGRHATVLVGIKDGLFIGENSWGRGWGHDGYYFMDPSVISSNDSKDFWVIQAGWEQYK